MFAINLLRTEFSDIAGHSLLHDNPEHRSDLDFAGAVINGIQVGDPS